VRRLKKEVGRKRCEEGARTKGEEEAEVVEIETKEATAIWLEGGMGEDLPAKVVVLALASASLGKPPTRRLCRSSGQNLALESASGN